MSKTRKPPASDGSNYYAARKFHDPGDQASPEKLVLLLDEAAKWTFIGNTIENTVAANTGVTWNTNGIFATTFNPNSGSNNFTFSGQATFYGPELPPDHPIDGLICASCPSGSRYRMDKLAHPIVIEEVPTLEDWYEQLAV